MLGSCLILAEESRVIDGIKSNGFVSLEIKQLVARVAFVIARVRNVISLGVEKSFGSWFFILLPFVLYYISQPVAEMLII